MNINFLTVGLDRSSIVDKILILTETVPNDYALMEWRRNGFPAEIIFKKVNKCLRAIRRLWLFFGLPFEDIWYADWVNEVKNANMIIFHVSYLTLGLSKYLNRLNSNASIIAWYWNSVSKQDNPEKIRGNCEIWSFDPENCKKYGLKFNHQYYFNSFVVNNRNKVWDVYFCGSDSGRGEEICRIYDECKRMNLKIKFQVVYPKFKGIPKEIISDRNDYDAIRENMASSRAILEIVRDGQSGATLRTMEALFFGVKLITNNEYIKQEEFYNEDNFFLLTERPLSELKEFINGRYVPYDKLYIEKYDVKQWIDNFKQ